MDFRVLGPIEVLDATGPLNLGGLKRRELLALLLIRPNQAVSAQQLADELWEGKPPDTAASALRVHVTHLRGVLEPGRARAAESRRLPAVAAGYMLRVERGELDAQRFEDLVDPAGAPGDGSSTIEQLEQALALWRGPPYADVRHLLGVGAESARLEELRLRAFQTLMDLRLARGEHAALVGRLTTAVTEHPLREGFTAQLMLALYRCERQAEALRAYRDLRVRLAEELGIEPAPELQRLERAILMQDPDVGWAPPPQVTAASPTEGRGPPRPHRQPAPPAGTRRAGTRPAETRPVRPAITPTGPLVGRARELARLEAELERAAAGRARPVVVRGEAGIGKSRLIGELIERNAERGTVLAVSCSEHLSAPYLPVVRLLEQLIAHTGPPVAERLEDVVRLLTRLPDENLDGYEAPAAAPGMRVRLFVDAVRAVREALGETLTICVIEDIQWADRDTRDLLETLCDDLFLGARALPLLLVMTERTELGSRTQEIGRRLERRAHASSLLLQPLGEIEVDELIRRRGIDRPGRRLVSTLFSLSQGNPLYVGESLRRIEDLEGFVEQAGAIETTVSASELGPPADLLDLVGRRLGAMADDVVDVLTVAAIAGNEVEPDLLERVTERPVAAALESAVAAGFLVETTEGLRFAHPLVRRALSDRPRRDECRRLHRRIAEGLLASPPPEHAGRAAEIAHHLVEGGLDEADEATMVFLWLAGRHAYGIGAWADAARLFDAGVTIGERLDADRAFLAWMKFASGRAHNENYDFPAALARYTEVTELARALGDPDLWGRVVLADVRLRELLRSTDSTTAPADVRVLDEVLEHVDESRPRLRSRLLAQYCVIEMGRARAEEGFARGEEAARLARLAGDPAAIATAESTLGMASMAVGAASDAARRLHRACDSLEAARRPDLEGSTLARLALTRLMLGQLAEAGASASGAREAYASVGDRRGECLAETICVALAALRGDFAAAEDHGRDAEARLRLSRDWFAPVVLYAALADVRSSQGDDAGADAALDAWKASGPGGRASVRALVAGRARRLDRARALLGNERELLDLAAFPSMFGPGITGALAEVAATLDRSDLAPPLLAALDARRDERVLFSPGWGTGTARSRGVLLQLAGEPEPAAAVFRRAIASSEEIGALPELARAHLDLGLLLVKTPHLPGDGDANEHLSAAVVLFERLGMPRLLNEAEAAIGATAVAELAPEPGAPRDRKVLMLTDIVESTRVSVESGDDVYLQLVDDHDAIVRRHLSRCGGIEAHSTGDGILAWFRSPDAALVCALAIRSDVRARNDSTGRPPLELRIGLAVGRPIVRDGNLYGAAVNLTARLCAAAPPGEALVDAGLRRVASAPVRFDALEPLELKGFGAPVTAYLARPAGDMAIPSG